MNTPTIGDPIWDELPDGVDLILDGDGVVGFAFRGEEDNPDTDEMNDFLARVGLPLLQPAE